MNENKNTIRIFRSNGQCTVYTNICVPTNWSKCITSYSTIYYMTWIIPSVSNRHFVLIISKPEFSRSAMNNLYLLMITPKD